jgi:uncharacterized phiE125 gp8 family phage protein
MNRLITPPAALAVLLADAKANLRIDGTDQDALITAWIEGITAHAEHLTGRSFINQTWRVTLDRFPDAIELPNPPLASIVDVAYQYVDGVVQILDPADYLVDTESEPGFIVPGHNMSWPLTYDGINTVAVQYVAGYGETHESVPNGIKLYIMATLAQQFDPAMRPEKETTQSVFTERLLDRYRVY